MSDPTAARDRAIEVVEHELARLAERIVPDDVAAADLVDALLDNPEVLRALASAPASTHSAAATPPMCDMTLREAIEELEGEVDDRHPNPTLARAAEMVLGELKRRPTLEHAEWLADQLSNAQAALHILGEAS